MTPRYDMVCCYVVRPNADGALGEVLQLRRALGEFMGGSWSTVRGRIEQREKAWQAALRELREETGIVPEADEFYQLDTVDTFYLAADDTVWHVPGFVAVVPRDVVVTLNVEHDDFRWIDRSLVDQEFLWPGERRQLEELAREIMDFGPARPVLRIKI
jgi:dihydroneopterin triphosphate diphosphatase